jgi:hypothetical protein
MTQSAIGIINLAKLAGVTATSYEVALPPENVLTDIGAASTAWQTLAGVTNASITFTMATPGSLVKGIGLFRTNMSPTAQISATVTSGGIDVWTETLSGPAAGYGQVVFVLPEVESADSITIEIDDPDNPRDHLNVPLVFIGDMWLPTYSFAPSLTAGWEPQTNVQQSRGGQVSYTSLANPRILNFEFGAIPENEGYIHAFEIARYQSMGVNVLVIPDIEGDYVKYDAVFGTLTASRPFGVLPGGSRIRTWAGTVKERL